MEPLGRQRHKSQPFQRLRPCREPKSCLTGRLRVAAVPQLAEGDAAVFGQARGGLAVDLDALRAGMGVEGGARLPPWPGKGQGAEIG